MLVYNYEDTDRFLNNSFGRAIQCGDAGTIPNLCNSSSIGEFLPDTLPFKYPYYNHVHHFTDKDATIALAQAKAYKGTYTVPATGYYCAIVEPVEPFAPASGDFVSKLTLDNPYGALPGADYPKLPFYGFLSLTYLGLGIIWMLRAWWSWKDLLILQHFVSGVIFFLVVEMAFNYGFYDYFNRWGTEHQGLLWMVVILNAGRNSLSFFMLLIVALGYGVLRPSLGSTMKKCVALGIAHFVCGVVYSTGSIVLTEVTPLSALLFALPLSTVLTAFYYFTINASIFCSPRNYLRILQEPLTYEMNPLQALNETIQTLHLRRQPYKLQMYTSLLRLLLFSAILLLCLLFLSSFLISKHADPAWVPHLWKYRWILSVGGPEGVYLLVGVGVGWLWRPTKHNERYGLDQVASEDFFEDEDLERAVGSGEAAGRGSMSPGASGPGIKLRSLKRHMHEAHDADDDGECGSGGAASEDDDDLLRWAEENIGDFHGDERMRGGRGGADGEREMERDMSDAMLLDPDDEARNENKMH
ncbi:hypothetical protein HDV05_004019 [Chytridiales sp. JEL 0842]|nr:hypothetical protein HDV05_004019 [Chytridiales sp. JEL 0842]